MERLYPMTNFVGFRKLHLGLLWIIGLGKLKNENRKHQDSHLAKSPTRKTPPSITTPKAPPRQWS